LVGAFAVWGIRFGSILSLGRNARVAQVGDTEISAQRFANALRRQQERLTRQAGKVVSFDMMRAAGIDRQILASMIRDAAFTEELKSLGIEASDAAVAGSIQNNASFQTDDGKFSPNAYGILLRQQGMSVPEFEALVRNQLGEQVLTDTVEAAVPAEPGAAGRIAAYQGERRGVNLIDLTPDMAPDPGTPDEATLKAFYDAHKPMFTEPERRWGEYILVDATALREELVPDEATLRATYQADIDQYRTAETRLVDQISLPDRAAVETAMGRLTSGDATFESLAAELGLKKDELSLGEVHEADLPEAAAEAVFGQDKPGVVGPVQLPAGFAIDRIDKISPASVKPFEEVRDQIADRLAQKEVTVQAPERANKIEEFRAEGLAMPDIAERAKVTYGRFDGLAQDGSLADGAKAKGVVASAPFLKEAFTALDAEERDLVELPDGGYLLVMINRIEPSALHPLKDVRDRAVAAWQDAERLKAIEAKGDKLAARLGKDASIWDLADELKVAVLPQAPFTRMNPPQTLPADLVRKIFTAPHAGGVSAPNPDGSRVFVAQVSSIAEPGSDKLAAATRQIDRALTASLKRDTAEYFARAIQAKHQGRIEPGVIEQVYQSLGATKTGGL
jgi:peptidyl-prolyl cis-trans isomerase D